MSLSRPETESLLARARDGDVEAFAQAFEGCRAMIHRVAYRLAGPDYCDDVVMETYLKAWRTLAGFKGRSALSTWLCRIARNCALDFRRRETRRAKRSVATDAADPEPIVERIPDTKTASPAKAAELLDMRDILERGLAQLSAVHRHTLTLREIDGLSYRDVAAATGVSMGTVMSRLFHARRRLRRILEASGLCVN